MLAPKGACRQVKSVTENEPRVACKFDIEATPDMPKRIRLEGGRGDYEGNGQERAKYVEKERERGGSAMRVCPRRSQSAAQFFLQISARLSFPSPCRFLSSITLSLAIPL